MGRQLESGDKRPRREGESYRSTQSAGWCAFCRPVDGYVEGGGSHEGSTRRIELAPSKAMVSDRFICRGMLQPGCCHVAGSIRGRNFTIVRQRCGDPISVA